MKWYKRLFWKVFAAIWVVSVLVLLATVLVIGAVTEKERFKDVITTKAYGYSEAMIERYERRGLKTLPPPRTRLPKRFRDDDDDDHHERREHAAQRNLLLNVVERVRITDVELGRKVIGPSMLTIDPESLLTFTMTSEADRLYRVDVDINWEHSPVGHLVKTLLSVQMVLVVLVSGLGGLLVSAIIVRPLNRLRDHTRAICEGELDSRTDEKLRSRGDELGELAREFDRMAEYVEQTLTSHQKLMQDVSHELRAPLARLQVAAGLAEQRLGQGDKTVQRIMRETERLDHLIGEILSLSKLEQMDSVGESFSLTTFLQELVDDVAFSYPLHPINLSMPEECHVDVNRGLLERALNNIINNACKHTGDGDSVDVSLCVVDGKYHISIRDHGPGVSHDQLKHLCEPFYRIDHQSKGYGLGLSIANRAMTRLGGELRIRNHSEGGLLVDLFF
jgi:signal transduction histidine kinase